MKEIAVQADYIICSADNVIKNGVMVYNSTQIIDVMPLDDFKLLHPNFEITYKPNSILTPGFINAHTHLELSFIHRIKEFSSFFDWVDQINLKRLNIPEKEQLTINKEIIRRATHKGTVAFGDITNTGMLIPYLEDKNIRSFSFIEVLGFNSENANQIWENVEKRFQIYLKSKHVSLSPHSVYGLSSELLTKLAQTKRLQSVHIDELRAERTFLQKAKGDIYDFLIKIDKWDENWTIPQETPMDYIESFKFKNMIYVHLLHVTDAEILHLKKNQKVVLCPRSNYYLHQELPKIKHFLDLGLLPAIGTDSLASNDDLSILDEMKFIAKNYSIPLNEIFRMGTENGANVLDFNDMGIIKKNNSAVCNYFQYDVLSADPFEQLLNDTYKSLEIINL